MIVTIDDVRAAWEAMEDPTASRICKHFAKLGRAVNFHDVRRWSMCGWDAEKAKALQTTEQRNYKAEVGNDSEIEKYSDAELIREVAREGMRSTLMFSRHARRRRKALVENPRELGALIQSLSRAARDYLELYRETITLAERAMKNVDEREDKLPGLPPPVDLLENEIVELQKVMDHQGIKH